MRKLHTLFVLLCLALVACATPATPTRSAVQEQLDALALENARAEAAHARQLRELEIKTKTAETEARISEIHVATEQGRQNSQLLGLATASAAFVLMIAATCWLIGQTTSVNRSSGLKSRVTHLKNGMLAVDTGKGLAVVDRDKLPVGLVSFDSARTSGHLQRFVQSTIGLREGAVTAPSLASSAQQAQAVAGAQLASAMHAMAQTGQRPSPVLAQTLYSQYARPEPQSDQITVRHIQDAGEANTDLATLNRYLAEATD